MISAVIDGFVPSLLKSQTLKGYAAHSRDGIQFMDLGSCVIRYRKIGRGSRVIVFEADPPVVIEHYDYLVSQVPSDFTVVIFEPPGFGFSIPSTSLDYNFASLVSLTEVFLQNLALGCVTLVAPCVLGFGAIALAYKRPDLLDHIVLSQVPSWGEMLRWKEGRDPRGLLSKPILSQLLLKALKRKRTLAWFEAALGRSELITPFNELAQQAYQHGATFNLASAFQRLLVSESPLQGTLFSKPLTVRALFLWGERDLSHKCTCKHSSLNMIPEASLLRIAEAGHFPELEAPDVVLGPLINFVLDQDMEVSSND
ncbi:alpha/beta fold hydrolase [Microbulbifer sp. JTAC008]|uniref:alpha/beta fold hydrolase n=1 Tax=unclassified Microbulbifer TaxID=2619833 RepID=UPI004039F03C